VVEKTGSQRAARWRVTKNGMRALSMRMAVSANSPAFSAWVPRQLTKTAPGGNQSVGSRVSTPAEVTKTHFRLGAVGTGNRSRRTLVLLNTTSASAAAAGRSARSSLIVASRIAARSGWRSEAARNRSTVTRNAILAERSGTSSSAPFSDAGKF
jgi:hypothetical protein